MAFITLSGTLRDPTSELAVGDQIRFTHKSTTGETVEGAVSVLTIDPSGTYSKDLQYGLVLVEYKDVRTSQFKNLGVATVNGSNPATSIPELLNALVPVSSAELIEFQAILADAVTARNEAEAFANSIDLINDLSQAYIFGTVAEFKASLIEFPDSKIIHLLDRGADFTKITGTVTGTGIRVIASTNINQSINLIMSGEMNVFAFGITGTNDSAALNEAFKFNCYVPDFSYDIDAQINIVNPVTIRFASRESILLNNPANMGNLLSVQSVGVTIKSGTLDGNAGIVQIGSAVQDGSLVSVTANSGLVMKNTKLKNVLGNNGINDIRQCLLNINLDGVVFELDGVDFEDCYLLQTTGVTQDAQFVSFKGNTITTPTRGIIRGGSMIGVANTLVSGTGGDNDGKCIRGYYDEVTSGEQIFDIEITGVYSTQYNEAFVKMTGMKGMNIHHNPTDGLFTQPWDSVDTQPTYYIRNAMTTQTEGITSVSNNTIRGSFLKLFEFHETTECSENTISLKNLGSLPTTVLYELAGTNINIHNNTYELQSLNRIFNFIDTVSFSRWSREAFGFVLDGDEGGGLGRRLIFGVADVDTFEVSGVSLTMNIQNATQPTDIAFMNAQDTNGNITDLSFTDFNVTTNYHFNHMPRISGTASVIDGVSYDNVKLTYNSPVTLTAQVSYETLVTHPKNISMNGFEIELNGLSASTIHALINLDEMFVSTIKCVKISDKLPSAFTTGFAIQIRGDGGSPTNGLDISGITLQNLKAGTSRCVDITNMSNARIENITLLNTVNNNGSITGIQITACDDMIVGKISANDTALSSWTNLVKIVSGDNYMVGSVNCRGTKLAIGAATNVINNT